MKTVVIFVYSERSQTTKDNLNFFIKNGVVPRNDIDYILVINGQSSVKDIENVKIVRRSNNGGDFGGWGYIVKSDQHWDRYILINDTCRGPYLPKWFEGHWVDAFCSKLKGNVKLVGPTENHAFHRHIQSWCLGTDKEGLMEMLRCGIFDVTMDYITQKHEIIQKHEIGASKCIIEKGWDIYSFLLSTHKIKKNDDVQYYPGLYFGITPNPVELMFIKTTCINDDYVKRYTEWLL